MDNMASGIKYKHRSVFACICTETLWKKTRDSNNDVYLWEAWGAETVNEWEREGVGRKLSIAVLFKVDC